MSLSNKELFTFLVSICSNDNPILFYSRRGNFCTYSANVVKGQRSKLLKQILSGPPRI